MNVAEKAYKELFGTEQEIKITYSGRFKGYNARIEMQRGNIEVKAAKEWKGVSEDIQIGLVQELLVKLYKKKIHTVNMDLYSNFIKSLPRYTTKTHNHPILEQSFNRINERFFKGVLERPNLRWGNGITQLGKYEYATDTITLSRTLAEREDLLDYVMYHEILHKTHQFTAHAGRHRHHTAKFRKAERAYPNSAWLEEELGKLVNKGKRKFTTRRWSKIDSFLNRFKHL